ncbi:zinc finger X-chromosomal protein-like [Harmonia axyridis]|uniref:zinc finger X-chromosomal protein-like n=1 Tax=Harmonia axyridis TaxID=115357 RepID=UPI001E2786AA|nr:zinc finger X-chromosomal protein-like [Harmonia axyridis]
MDRNSEDGNEIIKVIIVAEDGTESEVDSNTLNCINLEISNTNENLESKEDDGMLEENISHEDALLLENIKVEMIEDPELEFGEYFLSQDSEENSEKEYYDEYIDNEENTASKKRKRGRPLESNKRRNHICDICGYSTYQKSHYRRHITIHSKPDGIRCSICRREMDGKVELADHMERHRCQYDRDRYQCNLCSYSSKKLTNVSQHTEIHYKPEKMRFECENCDFSTTNQTLYKKHLHTHRSSRSTKCPVCLAVFQSMTARRNHLLKYKNGPDPNKYQCPECSYRTIKFNNFKQHMVVHRNEYEIEMFQCTYCPFKSKRKTDLRQHIIVKHKTDEEVHLFKCDFCSYESRRGNHLTSHMKNRHQREIIMKKCGLCSYKTVSQVLIEKHCNIHSKIPEQFFLCTSCGSGFLSPKLLEAHMETSHLNDEQDSGDDLIAEHVPKIEPFDEDLGYSVELHKIRIEDDEGYFIDEDIDTVYCCQFPQCEFNCTVERDAKIHKTISHNKRGDDNRCPECTFHTTSRYLYLDHLKVHKIDIEHLKPHLCHICGTRWIRQGDLTRHLSAHWGNDAYQKKKATIKQENNNSEKRVLECSLCSYTTRLRLCLYKHMQKHGEDHQKNFIKYIEDDNSYTTDDIDMYIADNNLNVDHIDDDNELNFDDLYEDDEDSYESGNNTHKEDDVINNLIHNFTVKYL